MEMLPTKKVTKEEAAKLDKAKRGVCLVNRQESEVEGQALVQKQCQCPWCGMVSWIVYDTVGYHWYTCCYCGRSFTA